MKFFRSGRHNGGGKPNKPAYWRKVFHSASLSVRYAICIRRMHHHCRRRRPQRQRTHVSELVCLCGDYMERRVLNVRSAASKQRRTVWAGKNVVIGAIPEHTQKYSKPTNSRCKSRVQTQKRIHKHTPGLCASIFDSYTRIAP